MQKYLVTGGTGFLGAHLLRDLVQKKVKIRALRRQNSPMDLVQDFADQIEWVEGDVTDIVSLEAAFEGVTHVYHAAAMVSFHPRDRDRMMNINVAGTANVVNFCLEFGVKKLVHVSSIAAVGRSSERPQLDETCKWVASSLNTQYALSKYHAEQEVWRGQAEGLEVAIVNPAIILGSGFWNAGSARFFTQVQEKLAFWPPGTSGFVDVRDVSQFMIRLMESDISGERYILNAENVPYRTFFQMVAAELNTRPPFIKVTPLLAEIAWRVEWLKEKLLGKQPMVTKESARTSLTTFFYDNKKSLQAFDFQYITVEKSVQDMALKFLETDGRRAVLMPFRNS